MFLAVPETPRSRLVDNREQVEYPIRTDQPVTTNANEIQTTNLRCICGKVCKNPHGLKIHQTRMKCLRKEPIVQRTGFNPGETQEEHPKVESPYSAQYLQAPEAPVSGRVK